ncbi:MAG: molybdopterin biosynthesis protein [Deltaproteobacteria bacterium]|nr:molybdopterin biosynthesis protein [Deltaproteobacteria bacterium]
MAHRGIHFLKTVSKSEAERIWHEAIRLGPLGGEEVLLARAQGRILDGDILVPIDVPPFDRALVDGYAVVAADTFHANEDAPVSLDLLPETAPAGVVPKTEVGPGTAIEVATGGVVPRGASAVQMVEFSEVEGRELRLYKPVAPGAHIQVAGADMRMGETVLRAGQLLTTRELGVLAALGIDSIRVSRRPRVAIISTGDELLTPGQPLEPGKIYDSNATTVEAAVRDNGGEAEFLGVIPDDEEALRAACERARDDFDAVILSGGTSKGAGDLTFGIIDSMARPGILVHGVGIKPGKPIVLAAWGDRPVVVLPGFPTSAIITFNLFVAPVIRRLANLPVESEADQVEARLAVGYHSAEGRHEHVLVNLVPRTEGAPAAYPISGASGSIHAFAQADGTMEVAADCGVVREGDAVRVAPLAQTLKVADLTLIGSHCRGVDLALGMLRTERRLTAKVIHVGSSAGVEACARGETDLAGVHLLDPASGVYNRAAQERLGPDGVLIRGYVRRQGIYFRKEEFGAEPPTLEVLTGMAELRMLNRTRGAGTRVLLDLLLDEIAREKGVGPVEFRAGIAGYDAETRSHNAVAAAVASGRADWGLGIEAVAVAYELGFAPLRDEEYDFLSLRNRLEREPVQAFLEVLRSDEFRKALGALPGFVPNTLTGELES